MGHDREVTDARQTERILVEICFNLGKNSADWLKNPSNPSSGSRTFGEAVKPLLSALVVVDRIYLALRSQCPPLYQAGVVYKEEPQDGIEEFAAIPVVLERGWGDCDDLAPWRCAELRHQGENASIRLQWKKEPKDQDGPKFKTLINKLSANFSPQNKARLSIILQNNNTPKEILNGILGLQRDTELHEILQKVCPLFHVKGRLYHVLVRRGNGQLEDPSKILGMGKNNPEAVPSGPISLGWLP